MSPPKIEEIDNHSDTNVTVSKPKKNPFATRPKKVTVKRTVDEAYPKEKVLTNPNSNQQNPLTFYLTNYRNKSIYLMIS